MRPLGNNQGEMRSWRWGPHEETPEGLLCLRLSSCRCAEFTWAPQQDGGLCASQEERSSPDMDHAGTLIWLPASRILMINFCCSSYSVYIILLWQLKLSKIILLFFRKYESSSQINWNMYFLSVMLAEEYVIFIWYGINLDKKVNSAYSNI